MALWFRMAMRRKHWATRSWERWMIRCFKMTWFSPTVGGEGFLFSGKKIETTKANSTFSHCQPDKFHILDSMITGELIKEQDSARINSLWCGAVGVGKGVLGRVWDGEGEERCMLKLVEDGGSLFLLCKPWMGRFTCTGKTQVMPRVKVFSDNPPRIWPKKRAFQQQRKLNRFNIIFGRRWIFQHRRFALKYRDK